MIKQISKIMIIICLVLNFCCIQTLAITKEYIITENQKSYCNIIETDTNQKIDAESAILLDVQTGAILYGKDIHTQHYPASITKIMTALVVLDNCDISEIMTYSNSAVNDLDPDSSRAGINVGAELTVEDSLYAMLIVSANESAAALAEYVAGDCDSFANMMTEKAKELGCKNTTFKNPHGLPDEEHITTAYDMALIVNAALKHDEFREIMNTESYTIEASETLTDKLELWNRSKLMRKNSEYYYKETEGSKTGYTNIARKTLASYATKDSRELICIVLKDEDMQIYTDTTKLFNYGFNTFVYKNVLENYDLMADIQNQECLTEKDKKNISSLDLIYENNLKVLDIKTTTYKPTFNLNQDVENGKIGYISIEDKYNNKVTELPITFDVESDSGKKYIMNYKFSQMKLVKLTAELISTEKIHNNIVLDICLLLALSIFFILIVIAIKRKITKVKF